MYCKFLDHYLKNGAVGARKAVSALRSGIVQHLKDEQQWQSHWEITIRLYAKMTGLEEVYVQSGIVDHATTVRNFYRGFNEVFPDIEAIDAGDDKEGADVKVKGSNFSISGADYESNESSANLASAMQSLQCKHIIVAGSADKGYVGTLRQYAVDSTQAERISMVESVPFPAAMKIIANSFRHACLADVFRTKKIVVDRHSMQQRVAITDNTYAATVAQSPSLVAARATASNSTQLLTNGCGSSVQPKIHLNKDQQRIDLPLPPSDLDLVSELRALKLCNRHFLTTCTYTRCDHTHDHQALTEEERAALQRVARQSACGRGLLCQDRNCVAAHNCSYGDRCNRDACQFPHVADRKVVESI